MVGDDRIQGPLAEAAGISTKASNYLEKEDTNGIVIEFIKNYLEPITIKSTSFLRCVVATNLYLCYKHF